MLITVGQPCRNQYGPRYAPRNTGSSDWEFSQKDTGSPTQGVPGVLGQRLHHWLFDRKPETEENAGVNTSFASEKFEPDLEPYVGGPF